MSDEEVITALGFQDTAQAFKQDILDAAHTTVELRTMGLLDELMNEEQANEFHRIKEEQGNNPAWDYLNDMLEADVNDLYQATMRDYVEQHKSDKDNLGL